MKYDDRLETIFLSFNRELGRRALLKGASATVLAIGAAMIPSRVEATPLQCGND